MKVEQVCSLVDRLGNVVSYNYLLFPTAFKIYNAGFDVWLGDFRGTGLSVNHTKLTVFDHEYWNFR